MSFLRGFFCFILFFSFFLSSSRTFFSVYLNYFQFEKSSFEKVSPNVNGSEKYLLVNNGIIKIIHINSRRVEFCEIYL